MKLNCQRKKTSPKESQTKMSTVLHTTLKKERFDLFGISKSHFATTLWKNRQTNGHFSLKWAADYCEADPIWDWSWTKFWCVYVCRVHATKFRILKRQNSISDSYVRHTKRYLLRKLNSKPGGHQVD